MHQNQVILGDWDEVWRQHAAELRGHRVEIRVLDDGPSAKTPKMIYEGMFPQLAEITDADFAAAEWHSSRDDDL